MPIYEYTCRNCHQNFEKLLRSMNPQQVVECPQCGSKQTERTLSVFAVGAESSKPVASRAQSGCCPCGKTPGACSLG